MTWYDQNVGLAQQVTGLMTGVYTKLPVQLARIALILWCFRRPMDPTTERLDAETMAGAIELIEYFRAHAHRVMTHFGVSVIAKSGGLTGRCYHVLCEALGERLTSTQISSALGGHVSAANYERALDELVTLGLAEFEKVPVKGGEGGRPSKRWRVAAEKPGKLEKVLW